MALERNGDMNPLMADRPLMRNWDFVRDSKICPLFLHTTSKSVKTFNYFLCKMLRDNTIGVSYRAVVSDGARESDEVYATLGKDEATHEYVLKVINMSGKPYAMNIQIDGLKGKKKCRMTTLMTDTRTRQTPDREGVIAPRESDVTLSFPSQVAVEPYSFTVYRFK